VQTYGYFTILPINQQAPIKLQQSKTKPQFSARLPRTQYLALSNCIETAAYCFANRKLITFTRSYINQSSFLMSLSLIKRSAFHWTNEDEKMYGSFDRIYAKWALRSNVIVSSF
jgi:hypothetical protein